MSKTKKSRKPILQYKKNQQKTKKKRGKKRKRGLGKMRWSGDDDADLQLVGGLSWLRWGERETKFTLKPPAKPTSIR